jgi:hypothetical protein
VRDGVAIVERLVGPTVANPTFGSFEMWVIGAEGGRLELGRSALPGPGQALAVAPDGAAGLVPFRAEPTETRSQEGFELPTAWRVDGIGSFARVAGEASRGRTADGGPALYDLSHAREEGGRAHALVFHLADRGAAPP